MTSAKERNKMDRILASVGGLQITDKDVDGFIADLGQRGQSYNTPEGRAVILEQLIGNKLLLLDARRNLYEAEPKFREELNALKERLLINYAAGKVFESVRVSDDEVRKYYDDNKEQFIAGETVEASHILVDSEELAHELRERIAKGELSFEEAAKSYSSCPSKENGGSLGEFGRGQMVPEFDAAVFAMEVGEISKEPVKTQFGYHLIRLDARHEAKPVDFAEFADKIKEHVLAEKQKKAYDSKLNQLKILYPVDKLL